MAVSYATEIIPLETGMDGVVRVGATRVTLDTVIAAYQEGATPETIVNQYPSLDLADVYTVIGYYLRRPTDMIAYLRQRKAEAERVRAENQARFDPQGIRDRLLARRSGHES